MGEAVRLLVVDGSELLTWMVSRLRRAKAPSTLKQKEWLILIDWIYRTSPAIHKRWFKPYAPNPVFQKRYHPFRLTRRQDRSLRIQFLHNYLGLVQTTLEIRPGKPVRSTHALFLPKLAKP